MLNLNESAYDLFKKWYIDGRVYFHAIIDEKDPHAGLIELRYIDPRKIRKVREVKKEKKRVSPPKKKEKKVTPKENVHSPSSYDKVSNEEIGKDGVIVNK